VSERTPPAGPSPTGDAGGVRWLGEDEQAAWRAFVRMLMLLPPVLESDLRAAGLTNFEYMVLAALSEAPKRTLRLSRLAASANSSLSRLSHVVARLSARGWVERRSCLRDGRSTEAILTDTGGRKVSDSAPEHLRTVRRYVVDALTAEELRQLRTIATKITATLPYPTPTIDPDTPAPQ
jgi:DNA-binding MarR family transcriptional regulator